MTVVGVPDIVVLETVDVKPELAIMHVDVRDKQKRNMGSAIRTTSVWKKITNA